MPYGRVRDAECAGRRSGTLSKHEYGVGAAVERTTLAAVPASPFKSRGLSTGTGGAWRGRYRNGH